MCILIHAIDCLKSWTINYMCTYSCNRLCEKLNYYSYGHVLVQLIVRRIRNMIVHMRILFITCVLDCMNSCTSDCLYEHPRSDPSSRYCPVESLRYVVVKWIVQQLSKCICICRPYSALYCTTFMYSALQYSTLH